jgi:beta-phosphoglucomutase
MNENRFLARAVLWDVDGTLIDSEEYHWLAWRETLLGAGFDLTRDQFNATFGMRNDAILRLFFGPELATTKADRIADAKEVRYRELVLTHGIELLPGVQHWLDRLKADRWRQAIASSAPRQNLDAILAALQLEHHFEVIIAAEDVTRGKPDPQVFLLAAQRLAVAPDRCIVIEDSPAGIKAARSAGMRSIGVGVKHTALPADRVVRSLTELPANALEELLKIA